MSQQLIGQGLLAHPVHFRVGYRAPEAEADEPHGQGLSHHPPAPQARHIRGDQ